MILHFKIYLYIKNINLFDLLYLQRKEIAGLETKTIYTSVITLKINIFLTMRARSSINYYYSPSEIMHSL